MTNSTELTGRTAIVTGASSGIGRAIAERFGAAGANLVLCSRSANEIKTVAEDITDTTASETVGVECDVTDMAAIEALVETTVETFDSVDILVPNAGGMIHDDNLHRIDEATFEANVDVNLTGQFRLVKAALPALIDTSGGSVVFMGTGNALTGVGLTSYSAAKGGLLPLCRLLAVQYGRHGVRANVISPGTIQTENRKQELEETESRQSKRRTARKEWIDQYPLGRFGRPDEVAEATLFLASERSSFISGTNLVVDGGLTAGLDQGFQTRIYDANDRPTRKN